MKLTLLLIGSGLPLLSAVAYSVSIIRGKSRPQRMTRLLLVFIGALSFATLWAAHDTAAIWLALVSLVEAIVIWALSWRGGMGGRGRLDGICFGLCVLGMVLWLASGESLVGLVMAVAADFVACLPALRKTLRWPHTEPALFYASGVLAALAIALASAHTFRALLYPVYIMVIDSVFVVAIRWPRRVAAIPTETPQA